MEFKPLLLYKPLKYFQWEIETLAPYQSPDGSCHWHRDKSLLPSAICHLPSFGQKSKAKSQKSKVKSQNKIYIDPHAFWTRTDENLFPLVPIFRLGMLEKPFDICDRTFQFSIGIINLCKILGETPGAARDLSKQLIRSGTSIGANVEESRAAQSTADLIHKLEIALKEARETRYWLRLIVATNIIPENRVSPLLNEIHELMNILASMILKSKKNYKK